MPEISGYHHLNLTVPDLEKSVEWYSRVLEFEKFREMSDQGWKKVILTRSGSQLILGLTAHTSGDTGPFQDTRTGMDHVAFRVPDRSALEAWRSRLDEMGVAHSPIKEGAMGPLIVFRDPDNIQLEVYASP